MRGDRRSRDGRTCKISWTERSGYISVSFIIISFKDHRIFKTFDLRWHVHHFNISCTVLERVNEQVSVDVFQREEAFMRAQKEAERKRQERELQHIQEEHERLQRKKVRERI